MIYAAPALILFAAAAIWWVRELKRDSGQLSAEEFRRLDEVKEQHAAGMNPPMS